MDFYSFHTPAWWQKHWDRSGVVSVVRADLLANGCERWMQWMEACARVDKSEGDNEAEMLRRDGGRVLGLTRLIARRKESKA